MKPERKQQLDDQWLDSLLTAAFRADERSEERIASVMQRLDQPAADISTAPPALAPRARSPWFSLQNLSALATAASLLVLATFVMDNSQQRAYATVARSAKATATTRHYRMQMLIQRPAMGNRELSADLYIDADNRFVMQHPGMYGFGTAWIGGDAHQRWIAPPRGPVVVGGEDIVGRWLSGRDIVSPYLHLSTILERMGKGYALSMLPDATLEGPDHQPIECTHVRGDIRQVRPWLPRTIELWADADTGVAQKVILHWPALPNRRGPVRWTIALVDTPTNLPNDWFEIAGHAAGRQIVRARTDRDLEHTIDQEP